MVADKEVFVAEEAGAILGTYYMRPTRPAVVGKSAIVDTSQRLVPMSGFRRWPL
jgi:hypothetical protein